MPNIIKDDQDLLEKLIFLASTEAFGIRKLQKIGNSHAFIVPKMWLDVYALRLHDDYWVRVYPYGKDNALAVNYLDRNFVESLDITRKEEAR